MPPYEDEWVLITGVNGAIGRSLARLFSEQGCRVLGLDLHNNSNENDTIDQYITADLGQYAADEQYAKKINNSIGEVLAHNKMFALVNNAAVQILGSSDDLDRLKWGNTLNTNLLAPFFLSKYCIPFLEKSGGSIVNISSIHAHQSKKGFLAYATSKAALSAMTRYMAIDLGAKVRVNAIEPAAVDTEMLRAGFDINISLEALSNCHPMGRVAEPMEVARLVIFLCSDEAKFIHGSCVTINGAIDSCLRDPGDLHLVE